MTLLWRNFSNRTMRGRVIAYFLFSKGSRPPSWISCFCNFCEKIKFAPISSSSCKIQWGSDHPRPSYYVFSIFVCLSVTRRYCIKTAKLILKLFRPSGSPIILVSSDPRADTQFQGEPFSRGVKKHGVEKKWRFSTEIAIYLRNCTR